MQVTLVRHAMPLWSSTIDPASWSLSSEGRRAAESLRDRLSPDVGLWLTSREVKASETLRCVAGERRRILQDARFDEVHRDEPFDDGYRSRRRAWVEGRLDDRHATWESPREAAERFDEAVRAHAGEARLVIGSHGMIITAWLVLRGRVRPGSAAGSFWEALAFPDLVDVSLDG